MNSNQNAVSYTNLEIRAIFIKSDNLQFTPKSIWSPKSDNLLVQTCHESHATYTHDESQEYCVCLFKSYYNHVWFVLLKLVITV